jgi:hypothetical protein
MDKITGGSAAHFYPKKSVSQIGAFLGSAAAVLVGHSGKLPTASNTSPFIPIFGNLQTKINSLQTRIQQGVDLLLPKNKTYCAVFSLGQPLKTLQIRLAGGAL